MLRTQEEAAQHSLFDVVMPIIGNEIFLDPKSLAADIYEKLLFEEQIEWGDFSNHNETSLH